jgi:hypothetical protein
VKVWLRRKSPSILELSLEKLIERFPLSPLKIKPARKLDDKSWRFLLEMALYDAHFSLMAWGRETGTDYDLKTAEAGWMDAGEDLLAKTSGCKPDKILFPIGNDFLHINNPEGLTPMSHNILDVDGRFCKIMETAERSLIRMIDRCVQVAPVHLLWVPGNHDPQTSYYLCRVLKAHYRLNARVFVDVEPPPRKYFHWGVNLIGFTHGNEEKFGDLPTLLASENRAIWHQVRHCEFHVGHRHVAKEMRFSAGDTLGGIRIRTIPSISGTDAWHFKKGYVQGGRMAEAFLFDRHAGLVANYTSRNLRYPKPEV